MVIQWRRKSRHPLWNSVQTESRTFTTFDDRKNLLFYFLRGFFYRVVTPFRSVSKYESSGHPIWRLSYHDDLSIRLNYRGNRLMCRLKRPDPYHQGGGTKQRRTRVSIKKETNNRYEGHPIPSLPRKRLFGFSHSFDQHVEVEWKWTHLCH